MSVIVIGMDMPDTCVDCELYHEGGEYGPYGSCEAHKVIFGEEDDWKYQTRPNWCPLRPLPEKHGDLIDRDAMLFSVWVLGLEGERAIETALAIVEAEGGDAE